jgi:hypothetical protein
MVLASIGLAILVYFTLHPNLVITPVSTTDAGAAFGTIFNLNNESVAALSNFSSAYCINSFQNPDGSQAPSNTNFIYGVPGQSIMLSDLARGDTTVLPLENVLSGPPGSQADFVFILRFRPGLWIELIERRFRFQGAENQDKTWTWKQVPLGSACG